MSTPATTEGKTVTPAATATATPAARPAARPAAGGATAAAGDKKWIPKMDINEWSAVATWTYSNTMENCSICQKLNTQLCIDCQNDSARSADCSICWGTCGHAYHNHCIGKWIVKKAICPICDAPWQYSSRTA